ncbi:hypothetical protein IAQ61_000160 [Plenodomus lingam]|uniref:uncharacterized protein n=1 Tax=Leptosphaeria maculans TaxID=5022 RepID=UPI0033289194|nr:hypothetical protein IAQ61_000160 [Plenodomus lingam]
MAGLAKPCSNPRIVRSTLHFLFPPPSTCQSSWNARQHKPSYSRDAPAPVSEPLNRTPRYWQTYRRRGECIAPASRVFCAGLSQEYSFDACLQVQSGLHSIWIHISFPALPSIIMISHALVVSRPQLRCTTAPSAELHVFETRFARLPRDGHDWRASGSASKQGKTPSPPIAFGGLTNSQHEQYRTLWSRLPTMPNSFVL